MGRLEVRRHERVRDRWPLPRCPQRAEDLEGLGILEVAELLDSSKRVGQKRDLSEDYANLTQCQPSDRWSRVDLLVGIIASLTSA